jgi:hypothetical protein
MIGSVGLALTIEESQRVRREIAAELEAGKAMQRGKR